MKHLKAFCDAQPKLANGHVRDILESDDSVKDAAVVSILIDHGQVVFARAYPSYSESDKNECYQSLELIIRDFIDSYNEGVDVSNEGYRREDDYDEFEHTPMDQEMNDAGHSNEDF